MNKTAIVRENPDLSAAELVDLFKKKHKATVSVAHIYTMRTQIRRNARKAGKPKANGNGQTRSTAAPEAASTGELRGRLDAIAKRFVGEILDALRGASIADILH